MNHECEALADAAERGDLRPISGAARRGDEARAQAAADLMWATGAATMEVAMRLVVGRPALGQERHGPSPQWRGRAPPELSARAEVLAERRGITVSELVRYAVGEEAVADRGDGLLARGRTDVDYENSCT